MGGTTAKRALPYPTGTDRVADGDNAMQALAERVEARMPWGTIGHGQRFDAPVVGAGTGIISTVAAPIPANRRVHVSAYMSYWVQTNINNGMSVDLIYNGATIIQQFYQTFAAGAVNTVHPSAVVVLPAGTYSFTLAVSAGGSTICANAAGANPTWILAEDIGPSV